MKLLIKPTPTPYASLDQVSHDRVAESVYFLESLLYKLGIDKGGKPMYVHTFTRKFFKNDIC